MPHHSIVQPLVDNHRRKGGGRVVTQVIIISFLLSLSWYDIILFELTDGQPIPKRKRLKRWHVQPIKNPEHLSVHPSPTQTTSWPLRHQWRTETRRPGQMHDRYLQGHEQTFYTHRLRTISFCQVPTPYPESSTGHTKESFRRTMSGTQQPDSSWPTNPLPDPCADPPYHIYPDPFTYQQQRSKYQIYFLVFLLKSLQILVLNSTIIKVHLL